MKKNLDHSSTHFYLAVSVVFAYPFSIRVTSVLIGLWAVHWIVMAWGRLLKKPMWSWLLLMVSLPLLFAVGLLYSDNFTAGVSFLERRISLLLVPVMISTAPGWDKSRLDQFFLYSYLSALLAALVCFAIACYNFVFVSTNTFYWSNLTTPLDFHPGYFSFFISIMMLWFIQSLFSTWSTRSAGFKMFASLSLGFLAFFLILLSSRVQLFLFYSTLILLSFIYVSRISRKLLLILIVFFGASVYLISTTFISDRIKSISSISYKLDDPPEKFNELTIRLALAECASDVVKANWLFGVGMGDGYDELEKVYRKYDYKFGYGNQLDPHNDYLNTTVTAGIVGLGLLLANFGLSFYLAWKRKNALHFLFIVFFAVSCLFESMLARQKGIVLFALLNTIFVFHGDKQGKTS